MWMIGNFASRLRPALTKRRDVFSSARRRIFTRRPRPPAVARFLSDRLSHRPRHTAPGLEPTEVISGFRDGLGFVVNIHDFPDRHAMTQHIRLTSTNRIPESDTRKFLFQGFSLRS